MSGGSMDIFWKIATKEITTKRFAIGRAAPDFLNFTLVYIS